MATRCNRFNAAYCNVRIIPKVDVGDVFSERIPNLYAAAKVTENVRGTAYVDGTLLKLFLKGKGN